MRRASWISFGIIVTLFAWMAYRLESSRRPTRYASEASCRAIMAPLWNRMFILPRSWAISHQTLKRQLPDEQLDRFLIPANLSQCHCARPVFSNFWLTLLGSGLLFPTSLHLLALLLCLLGLDLWLLSGSLAAPW